MEKQKGNETSSEEKMFCQYCKKTFSSKQYLKLHILKCYDYYEFRIQELEKQILEKDQEIKNIIRDKDKEIDNIIKDKDTEIKILREENIKLTVLNSYLQNEHIDDKNHIKEMSKNPITVNNNSTNHTSNMYINSIIEDISKIQEQLENNLNINHIIDGQKGIANFAFKYLLTDENGNKTYICSDTSRGNFKFMNENNSIIKDLNAKTLTRNLCKAGLICKANNIANSSYTDENGNINKSIFDIIYPKTIEINEIESNNSIFKNELASYTVT